MSTEVVCLLGCVDSGNRAGSIRALVEGRIENEMFIPFFSSLCVSISSVNISVVVNLMIALASGPILKTCLRSS
jgi:hypothetical protein